MFNTNTNSHYKTLKGWTKSSEFNRAQILEELSKSCPSKPPEEGRYKVKMEGSQNWQLMSSAPSQGASEWLYLNDEGVPVYYWKKGQQGLTII